jgi:hypothetical protein
MLRRPYGQGKTEHIAAPNAVQIAPLAGPVPPLQPVEHPGRIRCRAGRQRWPSFASLAGETGPCRIWPRSRRAKSPRVPTGIAEFDRVLGGGLVPGGSRADRGRSRHRQVDLAAAGAGAPGPPNKALRQRRGIWRAGGAAGARLQLDAPNCSCWPEINLERILATWAVSPVVAVIDSIQTVYSDRCSRRRVRWPRCANVRRSSPALPSRAAPRLILVGHVTKDGTLAGPRVLEHIVDTVLYFEGDTHSSFRLVRAFKNRFGAVNELGVFAMTEKGSARASPTRRRCSCRSTVSRCCRLLRAGHPGGHPPAAGRNPGAGRFLARPSRAA